jgi:hypothetical protein
VEDPEPMTTVRIGSRVAQIPLRKKRREAVKRLMGILAELRVRISTSARMTPAAGTSGWITSSPRLKRIFTPCDWRDDPKYIPA